MKENIIIGQKQGGGNLKMDVFLMLLTRLLIQANSGGGKSWLIRRLAEQLVGIMPVIIIDPEGEFATLREKFNFVLVGKGGETPADCRSAKLVMHKLLELRASAVIDLYELDIAERHRYVNLLCRAAIDAPKNLWRPTTFIFDEVHEFCPESGKGESEARAAVLAFPTKGRKRRFGSIFATQRLAKLAKDARAEFQNRMIGQTFEPDDLKVAASILGVSGRESVAEFEKMMRTMDAGNFFAFGRAICLEQTRVMVGPVETSHEIEDSKFGTEPPPAPEKIKALLPKLADLPKQAEEKAKTEYDLRQEIRQLKSQVTAAAKGAEAAASNLQSTSELKRLQKKLDDAMKLLIEISTRNFDTSVSQADIKTAIGSAVDKAIPQILAKVEQRNRELQMLVKRAESFIESLKGSASKQVSVKLDVKHNEPFSVSTPLPPRVIDCGNGSGSISKCERSILTALAQYPNGRTANQVAVLTGYSVNSGGFNNSLSKLRTNGFINRGQPMLATDEGLKVLGSYAPLPTGPELAQHWLGRLSKCEAAILSQLLEAHPDGMTSEDVAGRTNYQASSGGFNNSLSRLRTLELITRGQPIKASEDFFQ